MTFRTHSIPGLGALCPVQPVVRSLNFIGRQTIPFIVSGVPGDIETLQTAAGKRHQVLLKGKNAERVGNLKCCDSAIGSLGINEKPIVFFEKPAGYLIVWVFVVGIVEITQHGFFGGLVHGKIVMRILPFLKIYLMAACTLFTADKMNGRFRDWSNPIGTAFKIEKRGEQNNDYCNQRSPFPITRSIARGIGAVSFLMSRGRHLIPGLPG